MSDNIDPSVMDYIEAENDDTPPDCECDKVGPCTHGVASDGYCRDCTFLLDP